MGRTQADRDDDLAIGRELERKDAEIERLRALAKRLSDALLKVRPLGGSEMFIRLGEQYYADPDYCGRLIEEQNAALHEARKEAVRANRQYQQQEKA